MSNSSPYPTPFALPVLRPIEATDSIIGLTSLLNRAYARLAQMGLNYTAIDQTPDVTANRIRGGNCFVVHIGAKLVGTIVVQPTYTKSDCEYFTRSGVAAAHQFAVDPEYQGEGIGRMLLTRVERWAAEVSFAELAMDTAEQAEHLMEFYTRSGYRRVGSVQWPGKVYRSAVLSKPLGVSG